MIHRSDRRAVCSRSPADSARISSSNVAMYPIQSVRPLRSAPVPVVSWYIRTIQSSNNATRHTARHTARHSSQAAARTHRTDSNSQAAARTPRTRSSNQATTRAPSSRQGQKKIAPHQRRATHKAPAPRSVQRERSDTETDIDTGPACD